MPAKSRSLRVTKLRLCCSAVAANLYTAMAFGDEFKLEDVKSFALADFCERAKVSRSFFVREIASLCEIAIVEASAQSADPVCTGEEVMLVKTIADFVVQRTKLLLMFAKEIPKSGTYTHRWSPSWAHHEESPAG